MNRARVTEDFERDRVRVQLGETGEYGTTIRNFAGGSDCTVPPGSIYQADEPVYSLLLKHDEARALWEELCRYYGGHPPTVTDRADLVAERARVDKLTDAVIAIATGAQGST